MHLIEIHPPLVLASAITGYAAALSGPPGGGSFAAGRHCAGLALGRIDEALGTATVGRGPAGEPRWPDGVTGSITHKTDVAWAAVAPTTVIRSLGIDVECVTDPAATRVAEVVLHADERDVGPASLSWPERVVVAFSIKESVFKCLYPLVGRRFYYDALRISRLDPDAGTFDAELIETLSDSYRRGFRLSGTVAVEGPHVWSAVWLGADAPG